MLTPKQKQEIYDLLTATFDVGKPLLVAQAGNCLAGHGYHAKDLGYKGLNKVLEDMPEYVRFEQVQNEDGNPFWQMVLKEPKKEKKAPKKSIRTISAPLPIFPAPRWKSFTKKSTI